jgi:copper chaperone NosL
VRARSAAVAVALALAACGAPEGVAPIVWDREACAHCRMLIGEPRFAAQLQTGDGRVESFDDPGCLLARLPEAGPVRALWFHSVREDRWIPGDAVAFEAVPRTPMGYGLGAVDAGTPGAIPLAEAQARVAARAGRPQPPAGEGAP